MTGVLISTTIHVPHVLEKFRASDPTITFIVAGDKKSPHEDIRNLLKRLEPAVYLSDDDQEKLGYKSSDVIGWNEIGRRNIAILEAIKLAPDFIVTVDDDNEPLSQDYFSEIGNILSRATTPLLAKSPTGWFNPGAFLDPPVFHRGYPYEYRHVRNEVTLTDASSCNPGVTAGMWTGEPDIDAVERLANQPVIKDVRPELLQGIVVETGCLAPFNSQNTAFLGELGPLMLQLTGVGRPEDIYGAYFAQRVMMEHGFQVHFGKPIANQERNEHNIWKDLRSELFGMEHTTRYCRDLLDAPLKGSDVVEDLNELVQAMQKMEYIPEQTRRLGQTWCQDIQSIV